MNLRHAPLPNVWHERRWDQLSSTGEADALAYDHPRQIVQRPSTMDGMPPTASAGMSDLECVRSDYRVSPAIGSGIQGWQFRESAIAPSLTGAGSRSVAARCPPHFNMGMAAATDLAGDDPFLQPCQAKTPQCFTADFVAKNVQTTPKICPAAFAGGAPSGKYYPDHGRLKTDRWWGSAHFGQSQEHPHRLAVYPAPLNYNIRSHDLCESTTQHPDHSSLARTMAAQAEVHPAFTWQSPWPRPGVTGGGVQWMTAPQPHFSSHVQEHGLPAIHHQSMPETDPARLLQESAQNTFIFPLADQRKNSGAIGPAQHTWPTLPAVASIGRNGSSAISHRYAPPLRPLLSTRHSSHQGDRRRMGMGKSQHCLDQTLPPDPIGHMRSAQRRSAAAGSIISSHLSQRPSITPVLAPRNETVMHAVADQRTETYSQPHIPGQPSLLPTDGALPSCAHVTCVLMAEQTSVEAADLACSQAERAVSPSRSPQGRKLLTENSHSSLYLRPFSEYGIVDATLRDPAQGRQILVSSFDERHGEPECVAGSADSDRLRGKLRNIDNSPHGKQDISDSSGTCSTPMSSKASSSLSRQSSVENGPMSSSASPQCRRSITASPVGSPVPHTLDPSVPPRSLKSSSLEEGEIVDDPEDTLQQPAPQLPAIPLGPIQFELTVPQKHPIARGEHSRPVALEALFSLTPSQPAVPEPHYTTACVPVMAGSTSDARAPTTPDGPSDRGLPELPVHAKQHDRYALGKRTPHHAAITTAARGLAIGLTQTPTSQHLGLSNGAWPPLVQARQFEDKMEHNTSRTQVNSPQGQARSVAAAIQSPTPTLQGQEEQQMPSSQPSLQRCSVSVVPHNSRVAEPKSDPSHAPCCDRSDDGISHLLPDTIVHGSVVPRVGRLADPVSHKKRRTCTSNGPSSAQTGSIQLTPGDPRTRPHSGQEGDQGHLPRSIDYCHSPELPAKLEVSAVAEHGGGRDFEYGSCTMNVHGNSNLLRYTEPDSFRSSCTGAEQRWVRSNKLLSSKLKPDAMERPASTLKSNNTFGPSLDGAVRENAELPEIEAKRLRLSVSPALPKAGLDSIHSANQSADLKQLKEKLQAMMRGRNAAIAVPALPRKAYMNTEVDCGLDSDNNPSSKRDSAWPAMVDDTDGDDVAIVRVQHANKSAVNQQAVGSGGFDEADQDDPETTARERLFVCLEFCQTGHCSNTNCKRVHDPAAVVPCGRMLSKGVCQDTSCTLQHQRARHLMPMCIYHFQGFCRNQGTCEYAHMDNVKPDAPICANFLRGYCHMGDTCQFKHLSQNLVRQYFSNYDDYVKIVGTSWSSTYRGAAP